MPTVLGTLYRSHVYSLYYNLHTQGGAQVGQQLFVCEITQRLTNSVRVDSVHHMLTMETLLLPCPASTHSAGSGESHLCCRQTHCAGPCPWGQVPHPACGCHRQERAGHTPRAVPSPGACTSQCEASSQGDIRRLCFPLPGKVKVPEAHHPRPTVARAELPPSLPAGSPLLPLTPVQMHRRAP